jgi:hypothetical protein
MLNINYVQQPSSGGIKGCISPMYKFAELMKLGG